MTNDRNVIEKTRACLRERKLASSDTPVLLMVSGGSDSTALAYIASELRDEGLIGPLGMLHVNHQLRGKDADDDAEFVRQLADKLGIPHMSVKIDVGAIAKLENANIEAVARRERYAAAHDALLELCRNAEVPVSDGRIFVAHDGERRRE